MDRKLFGERVAGKQARVVLDIWLSGNRVKWSEETLKSAITESLTEDDFIASCPDNLIVTVEEVN